MTLLGRGTDCDLRLVDPGVSRHHAELRVEHDQVVLVDLGSTNGTFVNGQPVRRVVLSDGTHISLGRTTLVFRQDPPTPRMARAVVTPAAATKVQGRGHR